MENKILFSFFNVILNPSKLSFPVSPLSFSLPPNSARLSCVSDTVTRPGQRLSRVQQWVFVALLLKIVELWVTAATLDTVSELECRGKSEGWLDVILKTVPLLGLQETQDSFLGDNLLLLNVLQCYIKDNIYLAFSNIRDY